jgi:hypothetical protein
MVKGWPISLGIELCSNTVGGRIINRELTLLAANDPEEGIHLKDVDSEG